MRSHRWTAFALAGVLAGFSVRAQGAITNASGNVHVTATANDGVGTNNSNPADANFTPPVTGTSNSASATRQDPSGLPGAPFRSTANVNVTVNALGSINITGHDFCDSTMGAASANASVLASGSVAFTETTSDTLVLSRNLSTPFSFFMDSVVLKDASNATILSGPGSVAVTPGTYTVEWSFNVAVSGFQAAAHDVTYSLVPEPAALTMLILPALFLRRARRGHRCSSEAIVK